MSECCFTVKLSRASGRWQFFNVPLEETTSEAWLVIQKDKGKGSVEQLAGRPAVAATGTQVPYGITQCYLPPSRGDIPAFTPVEAGTRFSDPGGMQGWVDLRGWLERWFTRITVTHHGLTIGVRNLPRSFYAVVPGRDPNPRPLNRESDVLPQHHDARDLCLSSRQEKHVPIKQAIYSRTLTETGNTVHSRRVEVEHDNVVALAEAGVVAYVAAVLPADELHTTHSYNL